MKPSAPLPYFPRVLCLSAIGLILSLPAQTASAGWKDAREALDQRRVTGMFRIHYTTTGSDAIPGGAHADTLTLRLGEQLERADRFYSGVMGLTSPLANARYRDLRAVDVHVMTLEGKKGSTGDAAVVYRYRHFADAVPALSMSIANRWTPGNLTPEHEVFHAYQYGYTFFKNAWFLEGMANAMETAFRDRAPGSEPLPQDAFALRRLLDQSYAAGAFWQRLMRLCDPTCRPSTQTDRPTPQICGAGFAKRLLEELQTADKAAAHARGIDPLDWPEAEQRSPRNNPWLQEGLARAMEQRCPIDGNAELAKFLDVLKTAR
ncbi:MAG: hypothetical protein Q7U97_17080 [Rhodocyclaceae bacterium]|nr:hypothetical protein [Rhodocyclaceae bacterium]